MRLSAGTLLSQTGTHLPMVSCEVLREGRNKGAKRLCDNKGALRRAFKCGTQAARDKLCQSLRNYFFVQSGGLVWAFMERCKDTGSHGELLSWPLSSSWHKYIVNHLLLCWFDCNKKTCGPIREENADEILQGFKGLFFEYTSNMRSKNTMWRRPEATLKDEGQKYKIQDRKIWVYA